VQEAQGDRAGALSSYRSALAIAERLARADPANADWQRDLMLCYIKLNRVTDMKRYAQRALDVALRMERRGTLAPTDAWVIPVLEFALSRRLWRKTEVPRALPRPTLPD
jgi:hypothetical protein